MIGPKANLTTPQAVMSDHGGELTFWLAWLSGELVDDLCDWFRLQAHTEAALRKDLASIDQPAAREQLRNALEATNYVTPRDGVRKAGVEPLTGFALKDEEDSDTLVDQAGTALSWNDVYPPYREDHQRELHRRVSGSLFLLLGEVEVPLPVDEAGEATILLHHLVGRPSIDRFRQLDRWLNEARRQVETSLLLALDRVLHWLTPELFQSDREGFCYHLSFRLFLRFRLKDYCKQRGWRPAGPRYQDLSTAFANLHRERIGQIVYQAIEESETEALEQARVSPKQVLQWLTVAP